MNQRSESHLGISYWAGYHHGQLGLSPAEVPCRSHRGYSSEHGTQEGSDSSAAPVLCLSRVTPLLVSPLHIQVCDWVRIVAQVLTFAPSGGGRKALGQRVTHTVSLKWDALCLQLGTARCHSAGWGKKVNLRGCEGEQKCVLGIFMV